MKVRWFWFAVLLLALVSTSCQSTPPAKTEQPTVEKTEQVVVEETKEVQPSPTATVEIPTAEPTAVPATAYPLPPAPGPYPAPYPAVMQPGGPLYPNYQDGAEVTWEQALAMIMNGEVSKATQTHDLKVFLTLKDGRTLVTVEPAIDDVMKVIQTCGEMCKDIVVATE